MSFATFLPKLAEKWTELPGGSDAAERQFSTDLLSRDDVAFADFWEQQRSASAELRGWYVRLYGDLFKGRKVLEIGSGMGFDAIAFSQLGARWTCCDIAPSNLAIIERVAKSKSLDIGFLLIESIESFSQLAADYDAVWCHGSLLHIPYEDAREECAAILPHLKKGGRWVELAYPFERWSREGSPSFEKWGALTDGERTPWVEWYDVEKLKRRLEPRKFLTNLDFRFNSNSYIWMDLQCAASDLPWMSHSSTVQAPPSRMEFSPGMWGSQQLHPFEEQTQPSSVDVEIVCKVLCGGIAFGLVNDGQFVSREVIADAKTETQRLHLNADAFGPGGQLSVRNGTACGPSAVEIECITIHTFTDRIPASQAEPQAASRMTGLVKALLQKIPHGFKRD